MAGSSLDGSPTSEEGKWAVIARNGETKQSHGLRRVRIGVRLLRRLWPPRNDRPDDIRASPVI
jgi:hypothetical protein